MKSSPLRYFAFIQYPPSGMNMKIKLILVAFFFAAGLKAQVFMRTFDNAASIAFGGASIAYPGLAAGLNNDAQLGFGEKFGAFAGSAIPYGLGGWQTARFQGFVGLNANSGLGIDIAHSGTDLYAEQRFRLIYGRKLGEKISLGGSIDALRADAGEYGSVTTATFGISMLAQALPKLWLGADIRNPLQQTIGDDLIPTVLRIGACWKPSTLFMLLAETEKDLERPFQIKGGFEYNPVNILVLRAGVRTAPARIGFGAGLRLRSGLSIDVGSEWHPSLGITPAAMVVWRRGRDIKDRFNGSNL